MCAQYAFEQIGRLPVTGDNVAIATRRLEAGTTVACGTGQFDLPHTLLEGHRFAVRPIAEGEALLSWGLPFGHALRPIRPGDYVCNAKILEALQHRAIDFELPLQPNFKDHMQRYVLDESTFRPGVQVSRHAGAATFDGFRRDGGRGVGTRNHIVILGTSSLTGSYARALAERFQGRLDDFPNVEGVVAVAHTEGGGHHPPNNQAFVLRTLAGFMVHPNVGAVLAVDYGTEAINNATLRRFMIEQGYPLQNVIHSFVTLTSDFAAELERGEEMVRYFLPNVDAFRRTPEPLSNLKLALQCGGSDAFSGISGNPLAGWVAKEVLRHGGSANLAETDELIGAEPYVLENVRDMATARSFLDKIESFKERARWHGHSAEGNPSGGNNYRGLYNIALKSIGAARKKDPEVRLDAVIDYAEPMTEPGYYFMDSPGNDLESIAGQVAAGCNLILFITGNGSITNFPFVPTLKFVTTTGRWQMLAHEMDVNAGRYQDGTPLSELGRETFGLMRDVASGRPSLGEKAGHSQVSIWRDWQQTGDSRLETLRNAPRPDGRPLGVKPGGVPETTFTALYGDGLYALRRIGLVIPTSLCSAEIARVIARHLNARLPDADPAARNAVERYVALVHTEGCGAAPGYSTGLFLRTVLGHVTHPSVRKALLLEHGCEQTHNDALRAYLSEQGIDVNALGWASVQLDGGMDPVVRKAEHWFQTALADQRPMEERTTGLEHMRLGLTASGALGDDVARAMARVAQAVVNAGGLVAVPENAPLLSSTAFRESLLASPQEAFPSLDYGQRAVQHGFHIMATPTDHEVETLTGLGATGVELMLAHVAGPPLQAHPMIPLLQVSSDAHTRTRFGRDLDRLLEPEAVSWDAMAGELLECVTATASRRYSPRLFDQGNTDFQLTRGWLGLSL